MRPLPRNWLSRPDWIENARSAQDVLFLGQEPKAGTKAIFRLRMRQAGFDPEITDLTMSKGPIPVLDLSAPAAHEPKLSEVRAIFPDANSVPTTRDATLWSHFASHPFWATQNKATTLVLVSTDIRKAQRLSSSLLWCLHQTLGEEPEERMPSYDRFSIASWTSAESIHRFAEKKANLVDVSIFTAPYTTSESLYPALDALAALSQETKGLLVLEIVADAETTKKLTRTGIRPVFTILPKGN
jgi:hypothetical protein